jgi:putative membrane protein
MMNGNGMGGGWIGMVVVWAALIGLVVFAIVRLVGHDRGRPEAGGRTSEPTPREILDRRLARGEIDPDTHATVAERLTQGAGR